MLQSLHHYDIRKTFRRLALIPSLLLVHLGSAPLAMGEGEGEALWLAAECGDSVTVSNTLAMHPEVVNHRQGRDESTPLYIATQNGYFNIVKRLLQCSETLVDAKMIDGITPLMIAAQEGHLGILEALIRRGADLNLTNAQGTTALMIAAQYNHGAANLLLRYGADPTLAKKNGTTALIMATNWSQLGVVQALLRAGADPNQRDALGRTALTFAAGRNDLGILMELLRQPQIECDSPDRLNRTPLWWAASRGHERIVGALLDKALLTSCRVNLNHVGLKEAFATGEPPQFVPASILEVAIKNSHFRVIELLLRSPDINLDIFKPLALH